MAPLNGAVTLTPILTPDSFHTQIITMTKNTNEKQLKGTAGDTFHGALPEDAYHYITAEHEFYMTCVTQL